MTEANPISSVAFAKKLLELTEASWVDADEFEVFVQMAHIHPGEQKVDFTQRLLALIKRLPEKLVSLERKEKIIEAGQEYLQRAIEEEDELSESE